MESKELSNTKQTLEKQQTDTTSDKTTKDKSNNSPPSKSSRSDSNINIYLLICIIGVTLAITLEIINVQSRNLKFKDKANKRFYWVYSAYQDVENKNGLLKHVHLVLDRIGYEKSTNDTTWSLLWSHDYPFRSLYPHMHRLKPHQKVNHFPGTGFITSKVDLATSKSKFIPKAFKLPKNKKEFLDYAADNKNALFLEKHNQHRGVYLKNVSEIDSSSGDSFVQEYVQKPFLVDGHKFDIGVYVVLTSVNPLRAYWYKGDVLFRYCPAKYYPFDPKNLDKYVIGDDYLPTWEVPSLTHPYTALGFSMKEAFDTYATSKGKNTTRMWEEVQEAISEVFVKKENHIIEAVSVFAYVTFDGVIEPTGEVVLSDMGAMYAKLKTYPSSDNFFEMMRFDLVVDENLRVYLLEANMSPNLSSAHFAPNQLLYEQVLYNLFSLTGVSSHVHGGIHSESAHNMISSQKNIAVWSDECKTICKDNCDGSVVCALCKPCLDVTLKKNFLDAHREFLHKGDFRRLFPPAMLPNTMQEDYMKKLSTRNQLQYLWYQGKCNIDVTWCT